METPLVRELLEMKQEIMRQMEITERLTNQSKGNRKSYLEVENANIIKQRKIRERVKQQDQTLGLKLDDDKIDSESSPVPDGDVVNEVTISSEDTQEDDDSHLDAPDEDDSKRMKNRTKLKKNEESKIFIFCCHIFLFM